MTRPLLPPWHQPWLLTALLAVLLLGSSTAKASNRQNYPFAVDSERTGNGYRLVARNAGPAPVTVRLEVLQPQGYLLDRQYPLTAVVPPNGGTLYLGQFRQASPYQAASFSTRYQWLLGDLNALPAPTIMYRLPYQDGQQFQLGQSPDGPITTHNRPENRYAVDIPMPEKTPIVAARAGVVIDSEAGNIHGGQSPDLLGRANNVDILHADGSIASYAHLAFGGVYVYPGQAVQAGQVIGLAGSTGYSSGPHLHFEVSVVRQRGDRLLRESVPFVFYVGNPAQPFSPQFGLMAKADYSSSPELPHFPRPSRSARPPYETVKPSSSPTLPGTEERSWMDSWGVVLQQLAAWKWVIILMSLTALLLLLTRPRPAAQPFRRSSQHRNSAQREPDFGPLSPWQRLVGACAGDLKQAQRLMSYEYQRAPDISEDVAAHRAWERLYRDRR